jgi:hypothetical protein
MIDWETVNQTGMSRFFKTRLVPMLRRKKSDLNQPALASAFFPQTIPLPSIKEPTVRTALTVASRSWRKRSEITRGVSLPLT